MTVHDASGAIVMANPSAERFLGLTLDQMKGIDSFDPRWRAVTEDGSDFPPDQHPPQVVIRTGNPVTNLVFGIHRGDGSLIWVSANAVPLRDPHGNVSGVACSFFDVTERRRGEADLRASEERATAIVESIADGFFTADRDWRLTYVNGRAEEMLRPAYGRTRAQMLGQSLWELFPEVRGTAIEEGYRRAVRDRVVVAIEVYYPPLDGWFDLRAYPSRDGLSVYFLDITDRKRAEEAGRASEERYRGLVETAYEGIWTIDAAGRTTYVNHRMADLLGYAPEEMTGRLHTDFMWDQDRPKGDVDLDLRRQGKAQVWDQRYRRKDGSELWTVASCSPLYDSGGKVVGALGMFTDITERKRVEAERQVLLENERAARAEAERASRMKEEFLATLSHELRTPLNAILGWSQILAHGTKDAEDLAEGLRTIERNARAQTQIIEDLLDMSRIISGKVRLDVQRVDLAAVVRETVATVKPAADAKGIGLHSVLDPHAGPVSGDPARLQQVMWNLLTNAIKFTPRGGRVEVLLERVNSHLQLSVNDTGEGIAPEFLPHVFDRFRQADATTTRRHGGLGLGLSIVKQLVELHGGSVRAKSGGEGQGSTFGVSLPLTVMHPDPEPAPERRHPGGSSNDLCMDDCPQLAGVKVLVVDDEADARALIRRLLEDCDAAVQTAGSADEALGMIQSAPPDVLLSDIGMPGEDGYSLIKRVRALGADRGGKVPALALTAYARSEDRMKAVAAGYQMHLAKPVEPAELLMMVAAVAGRSTNKG